MICSYIRSYVCQYAKHAAFPPIVHDHAVTVACTVHTVAT